METGHEGRILIKTTSSILKEIWQNLEVVISVLRRINIRVTIYLDDMLLIGQTMEEILVSRDTKILFLQHFAFISNLEKSILHLVQEIEFLGVTVNSVKMTILLQQQNLQKI